MPDLVEAFVLAEILGAVVLLVCIFMIVNNAALAASDWANTRRGK
jgi:hypothetical protein